MTFIKRHWKQIGMVLVLAQIGYLLTLPPTWLVDRMFLRAVVQPHYLPYVLLAPALLAGGVRFNVWLKATGWSWLEWSPFGIKANLALSPVQSRWIGPPYALMLALCMPLLALFEEIIFRNGTTSWLQGILWGGLAFGALHLISFVSIRMTIYLALAGIVLVGVYMTGGLLAAFVTHAVYNLLALALLVGENYAKHVPRRLQRLTARVAAAN
jgi:hypothetical protein